MNGFKSQADPRTVISEMPRTLSVFAHAKKYSMIKKKSMDI